MITVNSKIKLHYPKAFRAARIDDDDIDAIVAEEIDIKGDELWEQGARDVLGDDEFERLYPELKRKRLCEKCLAEVTATDVKLGRCTQCRAELREGK